jgi:Cu/Ag efflux protein CusF
MPGPTFLDLAASIDRVLRRNIQWPLNNKVFADSPVSVTPFDRSTMCDASGGAMAVNLPDATLNKGMFFEVKKTDISSNTVTIACTVGGQTIDGAAAKILIAQNDFIVVVSDGVNYKIVALLISTPGGGGAVFYAIKKIVKTDGVATYVPVDGTLINFTVAVDGECSFWAAGLWSGFSGSIAGGSLNFRIDGVDYAPEAFFQNNGAGGDFTSEFSLSPHISLFLAAGPHTVELVGGATVLGLNASPADPTTLSVLYPAASFSTASPTPKAATLVVSPVVGIGDYTTIEAALAAIAPLGGGYILVREGTYTPPVGGYVQPNAPVEIVGCGSNFANPAQGTLIDLTGFTGNLFNKSFKHNFKVRDLTIRGTGAAGQNFFDTTVPDSSNYLDIESVNIDQVQGGISLTGAQLNVRARNLTFTPSLATAASFWSGTGGLMVQMDMCQVIGATITGNPVIYATNCEFQLVQAAPFVNNIGSLRAAICKFAGEMLILSGGSEIAGCTFTSGIFGAPPARYLDFPAGVSTIEGCIFEVGATSEDIRISGGGARAQITGNYFAGNGASGICVNLTAPLGANIANCDFHGGSAEQILINATTVDVTIVGCTFADDGTAPRAIDIATGAFRISIVGCGFEFFSTEAIQVGGARVMVVGCTGCKVVETATAAINRYANNDGFDPGSIIAPASLIEDENVIGPIGVDTTLDEFERTVQVTAAAANRTITLPPALGARFRKYIIKKMDATANTVTIDADGAETIDGALTYVLSVQYQAIEIQSDGTSWIII